MKRTYVIVGAGGRGLYSYAQSMVRDFSDFSEIIGVFDPNSLRAEVLRREAGLTCLTYTDFGEMISECRPDRAIITSVDRTHHEYIIGCLDAGIQPITEKPMTIDAGKCRSVLEAEKRAGIDVIVTFNVRFMPFMAAIKQAILDDCVGEILSVDYEDFLDTTHGADYFRRWHRRKENSGGLLVHKATHHFDVVNWWLGQEPTDVMAFGSRRFYGPTRESRYERCLGCPFASSCEFYFDIETPGAVKMLYRDCESADGYFRDRCVFSEEIDIEDTMSVSVRYSGGALLNYSLVAHAPYEGWRITLNGSKGRLEAAEYYSGDRAGDPSLRFETYDRQGRRTQHEVPKDYSGHGGGDYRLMRMLFEDSIPDPLGQQAGSFAGALSALVGIAANKSIAEGRNITIRDLVPLDQYRPMRNVEFGMRNGEGR